MNIENAGEGKRERNPMSVTNITWKTMSMPPMDDRYEFEEGGAQVRCRHYTLTEAKDLGYRIISRDVWYKSRVVNDSAFASEEELITRITKGV